MDRIAIVGATSPLGLHAVDALADGPARVRAVGRDPTRAPEPWRRRPELDVAVADLRRPETLGPALEGCTTAVWLSHDQAGPDEVEVNVAALTWVATRAASLGLRRLIFVSSGGSVYGEPARVPVQEDDPRAPRSLYGRAKKAMEDALLATGPGTVETAILRPGNIYGFHSREAKGVVAAFLRARDGQGSFVLVDRGRAVRDYIHADDVAAAIRAAIATPKPHVVWNVGTGVGTPTHEVVRRLAELCDRRPAIVHRPAPAVDVGRTVLDAARIRAESGWRPLLSLEDGLRASVAWWDGSTPGPPR